MYRTICTHLWSDKKVQHLTRDGKLLFVYLITNPHSHMCGIYYLPEELIKKEAGVSDTLCHTLWDTLSGLNLAHYDAETCTVFVVNMFSYQGKGEKNEKCAAKHLDTLHDSRLIDIFIERYQSVKQFCSDTLSDTLSHRGTEPSKRCPSVPVLLVNASLDSDLRSKKHSIHHGSIIQEEFEQFWLAYPRKVGKKKARQAWMKATDKPALVDILKAIEIAKKTDQWTKDNGKFIPHPSTWLNEGRWSDQPLTNGHGKPKPPPFPPKTDPIARGQWRTAYGDPAQYGYE